MRRNTKYIATIALVSVLGIGGTALLVHDKGTQGTVSDDIYWKKVANLETSSSGNKTEADDLIRLADRINSSESTAALPQRATNISTNSTVSGISTSKKPSSNTMKLIENKDPVTTETKTETTQDPVPVEDTAQTTQNAQASSQQTAQVFQEPETTTEQPDTHVYYTGWDADHQKYYIDDVMQIGEVDIDGQTYLFDDNGNIYTGWYNDTFYANGILAQGRLQIEGNYYYFHAGSPLISKWHGKRYYDQNGVEASGIVSIDGAVYYFGESGEYETGLHKEIFNDKEIVGYSNEDGIKQYTETIEIEPDNEDQDLLKEVAGIDVKIGEKTTLNLDSVTGGVCEGTWKDGAYAVNGKIASGKTTIAGRTVMLNEEGKAVTGWYTDKEGNIYYCDEDGTQAYGRTEIDGKVYYFDPETGASLKEGWQDASKISSLQGTFYMIKAEEKGKAPYMAFGNVKIGKDTYFFDTSTGLLQTNSKGAIYTDEKGRVLFGNQTIDGEEYYFDPETGEKAVGWKTIDGKTYYFDKDGKKYKGVHTIDGVEGVNFEFDSKTGELLTRGRAGDYFINDDGSIFEGLKEIDGNTYYFNPDRKGQLATGIMTVRADMNDGKAITCYFDDDGVMQTGFMDMDGQTYYFDCERGRLTNMIATIDGNRYWFAKTTGGTAPDNATADGHIIKNVKEEEWGKYIITTDENGIITELRIKGLDNPMLPANGTFQWFTADSSSLPQSPGNPFAKPWCTWWMWNRFYDVYEYDCGARGNGSTNADEIVKAHPDLWHYENEPVAGGVFSVKPGAGICSTGAAATAGHVGFIEKVEDGYVWTSEGGYTSGGNMGVGLSRYTIDGFYSMYGGRGSVTIIAPND